MKPKPAPSTSATALRHRAVERWRAGKEAPQSERRLVRELQVHQIELEMQNEDLAAALAAREEAEAALRTMAAELARRVDERTAELRTSEARYRALVEQIPAVTYTAARDKASTTLYVSPQIESMLGFTAREYAMNPDIWRQQLHSDDRDRVMREVLESHRSGRPLSSEYRMFTRAGEIVWVKDCACVVKDVDGKPIVLQGVMLDITERKRSEDAARESEARYRGLFANSRDAIMTLAPPSWVFTSGNPAALEMFGTRTESEFTAHEPWKLSPELQPDGRASAEKAREMIETAMRDGSHVFEWTHRRISGEEFPADVLLSRMSSAGTTFLQATVRDITARRQAEEELTQSHEVLRGLLGRLEKAREEERTRVARDVHDDLGQNLTAIKMDLRWIERALEKAEASPEIDAARTRAASATEIVDATTAAVQELATQLRPGVLDKLGLGPAIRFEARRFEARSGIKCRVSVPDALPSPAPAVATAVFRILQECLTNVARHSGATRTSVRLGVQGDDVLLRVHDNGKGIADAALDCPRSLGLLGMKERAAMVGGDVVFRPNHKGGTVVMVRIPDKAVIGGQQPVIGERRDYEY